MLTRMRREDGGYVLVVVMLSMILVLALITGVMSYAVGSRDLLGPRPGLERGALGGRGGDRRLHLPPEPGQRVLDVLGFGRAA